MKDFVFWASLLNIAMLILSAFLPKRGFGRLLLISLFGLISASGFGLGIFFFPLFLILAPVIVKTMADAENATSTIIDTTKESVPTIFKAYFVPVLTILTFFTLFFVPVFVVVESIARNMGLSTFVNISSKEVPVIPFSLTIALMVYQLTRNAGFLGSLAVIKEPAMAIFAIALALTEMSTTLINSKKFEPHLFSLIFIAYGLIVLILAKLKPSPTNFLGEVRQRSFLASFTAIPDDEGVPDNGRFADAPSAHIYSSTLARRIAAFCLIFLPFFTVSFNKIERPMFGGGEHWTEMNQIANETFEQRKREGKIGKFLASQREAYIKSCKDNIIKSNLKTFKQRPGIPLDYYGELEKMAQSACRGVSDEKSR